MSSNMPSEAERNAASVGTEVEINGAWTARILVTTVLQGAAEGLAMIRENFFLIKDILPENPSDLLHLRCVRHSVKQNTNNQVSNYIP